MKYTINNIHFNNKAEIKNYYKSIFNSYRRQEILSPQDLADVFHLLKNHPNYAEKTEKGINHIKVDWKEWNNNAFWIVHDDGDQTSFSYPTCISAVKKNKEL